MYMKSPPHPGRIVRQECLEPLDLTVAAAAQLLGVERDALDHLVSEQAGISPDMAVRLSKAFGSSARVWLGMQLEYDLAQAEAKAESIDVKPVHRAPCEEDDGNASLRG
jgi:addiction module HigA family antidote